ncbi:MAG: hypothetical protein CM1200mP2_23100 [Planctomycetaceae bacterium]|nr:MAG: hypothetical protein CM1200mP2_23100 [Planctomycetaceae bacterium]
MAAAGWDDECATAATKSPAQARKPVFNNKSVKQSAGKKKRETRSSLKRASQHPPSLPGRRQDAVGGWGPDGNSSRDLDVDLGSGTPEEVWKAYFGRTVRHLRPSRRWFWGSIASGSTAT